MNKYGLVDLSNPQWLERHIREYTVTQCADIVQKSFSIDWKFQYHSYLMGLCDIHLHSTLKQQSSQFNWKKILLDLNLLPLHNSLLNFKSMSREEKVFIQTEIANRKSSDYCIYHWHSYLYFELYRAYRGGSEADIVRSLITDFNIQAAPWYSEYQVIDGIAWMSNPNDMYYVTHFFPKDVETLPFVFTHKNHNSPVIFIANCSKPYPLFNAEIICSRECAVFLTDSFLEAQELGKVYGKAYGEYLKKSSIEFWNKLPWEVSPANKTHKDVLIDAFKKLVLSANDVNRLYSNLVWSSWFGGYDLLSEIDWSPLRDREIYLFQVGVSQSDALEHFVRLVGHLEAKKIFLVWLEKKVDSKNLDRNPFRMFSYLEALESAHNSGIHLGERQARELSQYFRDQGRMTRRESRYLIDPIIRLNSFIVISGGEGSGKSWLAMFLGAALSVRGKLFYDWDVMHKAKIVYVADDEMDEDLLDDRRAVLRKLYRRYDENFVFESVHRKNLLKAEEQQELEILIDRRFLKMDEKRPSVLILDHLNKLTDNQGNQKEQWPIFRSWVEDLNKKKITVILIHHEYHLGKMTGSVLIPQDADTHIHVEHGKRDLSKNELEIVYSVPKNRGAKDQRLSRSVILDMQQGARFRLPDEGRDERTVPWKSLSLDEQISQIKQFRESKSMQEIADYFERSKSFIEKFCQEHGISKVRKDSEER